jgi:3-oxoacyl-[acyl-carrier-protein] synthase-3
MLHSAYITSIGAFLPNAPVGNDQISPVLGVLAGQSGAVQRRVLMNNGIVTRHYAIDPATRAMTHTNVQLTATAIRRLQDKGQFSTDAIDCLACGTSSADQLIPSHATMVHAEINSPPCEVIGTSGVCCSGISALKYGYMSVASGMTKNAVASGSELASPSLRASHFEPQLEIQKTADTELVKQPMLAFSDEFLRWMLSDGAGAVWIENRPNQHNLSLRIDWIDLISFANESDVCMYCGLRKQTGVAHVGYRVVDDHAAFFREGFLNLAQDVRVLQDRLPPLMSKAIQRTIARRELCADKIDWLLPHYSSEWFRQPLFDGLQALDFKVPFERWFSNLTTKGNTGSAAIYIMLEELLSSGRAKPGQHILCMIPESARMTFGFMHLTAV